MTGGELADLAVTDLPAHLAERIEVDPLAGCWVGCVGVDRSRGYARIGVPRQQLHRVVWEELVGPILPGRVLDHVRSRGCVTNACCWPAHLEPVTHRTNILRGTSFAARNAAKMACGVCGTPYDLLNTYWSPDGHRDCRACISRRGAEYRARLRASRCELAA